jgi:hypothetical protein
MIAPHPLDILGDDLNQVAAIDSESTARSPGIPWTTC